MKISNRKIGMLTGSFLKNTNEVRVRINHRFFQEFQPIPAIFVQIGDENKQNRLA